MMKKLLLLAFSCLLAFGQLLAQIPKHIYVDYEKINAKNVKPWVTARIDDYAGMYHFGDSESEWTMVVLKIDSSLIFQAFSGSWGKTDKGKEIWLKETATYKPSAIQKGQIKVSGLRGFFAMYTDGEVHKGIVLTGNIANTMASSDSAELGYRDNTAFKDFFPGKYPQLSYQLLGDAWFKAKTKDELQLMRNEVFARYGLRFAKGGKMDTWFTKQDWYQPQLNNVTDLLNEIEKRNIEKIVRFEKE